MPLLERVRVEVYLPDPSHLEYENLLLSLEEEFTYAFGGCSIVRAGISRCLRVLIFVPVVPFSGYLSFVWPQQ